MINVKIYCNKLDEKYDDAYKVLYTILKDSGHCFQIMRVTDKSFYYGEKTISGPQIIINNQIIYHSKYPSYGEMEYIFRQMGLLS